MHGASENEYGRIPLLVTRTARTGKVLFMGTDAAWRWREATRIATTTASGRPGHPLDGVPAQHERRRVHAALLHPRSAAGAQHDALNANVMDASGCALGDATVSARIEAPSGRIQRIRFEAATGSDDSIDQDAWGLYSATFQPKEPGRHRATLTCEETGATLEAEIPVVGDPLEQIGRPARFDVMEELAQMTRGEALRGDPGRSCEALIQAVPPPPPIVTRLGLGPPGAGGGIVGLMALFWIGRKLAGRI